MMGKVARAVRGAAALAAALVLAVTVGAPAQAYEQRESIVAWGHGYNDAEYLVVHETANPGASARNHVTYWSSSPDYAVHYVMELDGSVVYRTVPDDRLCWHAGNANYRTVGIELAHATSQADFNAQWSEAVKWCGDYLASRGWGADRMLSHNECRQVWGGTDHTDPDGYFEAYGRSWAEFETAVAAYLAGGAAPAVPSASGEGTGLRRLPSGASRTLGSAGPTSARSTRCASARERAFRARRTARPTGAAIPSCWTGGMPSPMATYGAAIRRGVETSATSPWGARPARSRTTTTSSRLARARRPRLTQACAP